MRTIQAALSICYSHMMKTVGAAPNFQGCLTLGIVMITLPCRVPVGKRLQLSCLGSGDLVSFSSVCPTSAYLMLICAWLPHCHFKIKIITKTSQCLLIHPIKVPSLTIEFLLTYFFGWFCFPVIHYQILTASIFC